MPDLATKPKIRLDVFEREQGSDDPRGFQGGGGHHDRLIEVRRFNSSWLVSAYMKALRARYEDDEFLCRYSMPRLSVAA